MAEKQYKNYDERFLKEEPSGSRYIIEYDAANEDEVIPVGDENREYILKTKFPDGVYAKSADDLRRWLASGFLVSISAGMDTPIDFIYTPLTFARQYMSPQSPNYGIVCSEYALSTCSMVDVPTFEQAKQSLESKP